MQRELRNLLEQKVARGGDYYFDMQGGYDSDDLIAGGRRRRRAPRKKETQAQINARMAKVRAGKKHRGGDFVDINDLVPHAGGDFIDFNDLAPYTGGGRRKTFKGAKTAGFRNPIEQAERKQWQALKQQDWIRTSGPEYAAKLQKKAAILNRALQETGLGQVGIDYNAAYNNALVQLSAMQPAQKAAAKAGVKLASAAYPAFPGVGANAQAAARQAYLDHLLAAQNAQNANANVVANPYVYPNPLINNPYLY